MYIIELLITKSSIISILIIRDKILLSTIKIFEKEVPLLNTSVILKM